MLYLLLPNQNAFDALVIRFAQNCRLAESALSFRRLLRKDMALVGFIPFNFSCSCELKPLHRAPMGLHFAFRHFARFPSSSLFDLFLFVLSRDLFPS